MLVESFMLLSILFLELMTKLNWSELMLAYEMEIQVFFNTADPLSL